MPYSEGRFHTERMTPGSLMTECRLGLVLARREQHIGGRDTRPCERHVRIVQLVLVQYENLAALCSVNMVHQHGPCFVSQVLCCPTSCSLPLLHHRN